LIITVKSGIMACETQTINSKVGANIMHSVFTVAFFGHRYVDNVLEIESLLEEQIRKLINEKEYVEFLVGRNGDFDRCVSSVVFRMRKKYKNDNSALILVLPYPTAEYLNNKEFFHDYYTDVEISHSAYAAHPKSAIQIRNREMVDRSELVICCVEKKYGGAWQTVKYAKEQGKLIINIMPFE